MRTVITEDDTTILEKVTALSPTDFENLTFDCLRSLGLRNIVWRTPGADGGRDIEGVALTCDLSGHETVQKWYVECKRYAASLDWPTVWQKISYAEVSEADVLLVSTNSNPSPTCETHIATWNAHRRRPVVRFWRGYDFPTLIRAHPHVAAAYGLLKSQVENEAALMQLGFVITKIVQAAYAAGELGLDNSVALETATALSELLSQRFSDLKHFNRVVAAPNVSGTLIFDWTEVSGDTAAWEEVGIRALLAFLRYQLYATSMTIHFDHREAQVVAHGSRLTISGTALTELTTVSHWARAEITSDNLSPTTYILTQRA